jgi:hypothetical protein
VNAAESATFSVGGQVVGTARVVAGTARLTTQLLGTTSPGAKAATAVFNQEAPNYDVPSQVRSLNVLREDARPALTGAAVVGTGCSSCTSATVRLEATVRDISAVAPATDLDPDDIGTATVSFVNRATGAIIQTVTVVSDPRDRRTGKAVYNRPINIGKSSSQTFTIGMIVGNQYLRNSAGDDAKVTVVKR